MEINLVKCKISRCDQRVAVTSLNSSLLVNTNRLSDYRPLVSVRHFATRKELSETTLFCFLYASVKWTTPRIVFEPY